MRIRGLDALTPAQLEAELQAGSRFVFFEYCISLLVVTWRQPTDIFLLRPGERRWRRALRYTLVSLLLGWWGIPWGFVYTPLALFTNMTGGRDVTAEVRAFVQDACSGPTPEVCQD